MFVSLRTKTKQERKSTGRQDAKGGHENFKTRPHRERRQIQSTRGGCPGGRDSSRLQSPYTNTSHIHTVINSHSSQEDKVGGGSFEEAMVKRAKENLVA
ncbi:Fe2OG dioxygenase domain-containing protein [Psidium guajava]|nr:Fe2OG dioxygenase domain-containing protein [Psidium guajava]